MGGKSILASGALWFAKGDVESPFFLFECKYTDKDFYTFKLSDWEKLVKESYRHALKTPVFNVSFLHNQSMHRKQVFIMEEKDVEASLVKKLEDYGLTAKSRKLLIPDNEESFKFQIANKSFLTLSEYSFFLLNSNLDKT